MRLGRSLLFVLAVALAGCGADARRREAQERFRQRMAELDRQQDSAIEATRAALLRELPKREAQWASHKISDYRIAIRVSCFCDPPPLAVVTVRGDSTEVRNALDQLLSEQQTKWLAFSVIKLFNEVRRMVADTAWEIHASFDSTYGFPRSIRTDHRRISDAGYHAMVEGFEMLPRQSPPLRRRQN